MFFGFVLIEDVEDGVTFGFQIVSDQTAMTAPPHRLRTHHRRTRHSPRPQVTLQLPFETLHSPCGPHKRETTDSSTQCYANRRAAFCARQASARACTRSPTSLSDSASCALIELRIATRTRKASHINQHFNLVRQSIFANSSPLRVECPNCPNRNHY